MRKSKKQLLGIGGLAVVAAITTIAANLPTNVGAVGAEVQVQVNVYDANGDIKFITPTDQSVNTGANISISNMFSKADHIDYTVTKDDGTPVPLSTYVPTSPDGQHRFEVDLRNFGGYGRYTIKAKLTAENGTTAEDYISIIYSPIDINEEELDHNPTGKNPIIPVDYDENTEVICVNVKDLKGNVILTHCVEVEPGPGTAEIELPFDENGIEDGEYVIEVVPYKKDADGELEKLDDYVPTTSIRYTAPESPEVPKTDDTPEVPNTGFGSLHLSKTDMVTTSLIGFAIVAGVALRAMSKKTRK